MRILTLLALLFAIVVGGWFGWENQQLVTLTLIGNPLPEAQLGIVVLLVFLIGAVVGIGCAQFSNYRLRFQLKRLRAQQAKKELAPRLGSQ